VTAVPSAILGTRLGGGVTPFVTLGRHPLGEQRVRRAVAVGGFVAEKRDEVADRGKADAEHLGAGRFVPEVINLERREEAARRQGPDRLRVGELP